ncbi:receptor-like protein 7 [Hibiscus syriacus]|uniref:receptor-like protein 7 n=1 Tax=Hibiscus syriacus TaxID=106335 RepID=UPI001924320B|nr:receptor-like protein 7 [Hibiscus syriacus]
MSHAASYVLSQHDLYYAPNFTLSSKFELWDLNTDCCSWEGVTCDALGHVIGLDLNYKYLSGTFHSIFDLHHLQRLNLAGNNFNTTLVSYGFDKLQNLTHLNLSSSCFHGQIPVEISFLTRLVSLDLSYQDGCYRRNGDGYDHLLTLRLEKPNFKTLTMNLRLLKELYLDGPLCSSLSRLHFLSKLILDENPISYLPRNFLEISSGLVSLSLVNCNLSDHFPTEILLLPNIQSINISSNYDLVGQLPEFPSNNALRSLSLYDTNFSGKLPESIGNLNFLRDLILDDCNFLGSIPSSIASLGLLLPEFSSNNALRSLSLSGTNFSGKLPESIGKLMFLRDLTLYDCYLFGSIPWSIANLTHLVNMDLSDNNFSGLIPPFHRFGVPNLTYLNLEGNKLYGSIPSSLFTLPSLRGLTNPKVNPSTSKT